MSEFAPIDGLAGGWQLASGEGAAYLIHDNGASLVIRQTAPPRMPTIDTPGDHGDHYALDFQPMTIGTDWRARTVDNSI